MDKKVIWVNGHTTLTLKNGKIGSRQFTKEQYRIAAKTRSNFRKWIFAQGKGIPCPGKETKFIGNIGLNYHDGKCCDEMMISPAVTYETVKEFVLSDLCSVEEIEIQAEHAFRLYQRVKSFEVPYSKDYNKEKTSIYRGRRQVWLDLLHAKTQA